MNKIIIVCSILLLIIMVACTPKQVELHNQDVLLTDDDASFLELQAEGCTTQTFETNEFSSQAEYSMCNYSYGQITEIIIELTKFTNQNDLNGSYQYNSLHLINSDWLLSENTFGDQSRFQKWNESTTYYYHLWITKDNFLIHITSKGDEQVQETISHIGQTMLGKIN